MDNLFLTNQIWNDSEEEGNFDVENKRKVRRLGQLDPNAAASSTFRACQLFSGVNTLYDVQVELMTSEKN